VEQANKQRNLAGQLVVDAVPAPSPVYLEAIMGRDLRAKRDDAVGRASGETTRPRWRRLLGVFSREHDTNPAPPSAGSTASSGRSAAGAGRSDADLPPLPGAPSSSVAPAGPAAPGVAGGTPADPAAKKDDGLQQTSASGPAAEAGPTPTPAPTPRRRLLDVFRRNED
jgi:hypothetical protein